MQMSKFLVPVASMGVALAISASPGPASAAVAEQDFYVRTTSDLVKLCSTDPSDPLYSAAIHFCHGFGSGAYQAEQLHRAGSKARPLFCLPTDPQPTRNEVIAGFVKWTATKSEVASTPPAEGLFEYMMATYPCSAKKR
jgi:hypothetical protein